MKRERGGERGGEVKGGEKGMVRKRDGEGGYRE